jgi:hypothetical protein
MSVCQFVSMSLCSCSLLCHYASLSVYSTSKILNFFKRSKVPSIIKPGKDETYPALYRSISLLCVVYKLLERLILQRIQLLIEDVTLINQAGFRQHLH